jgi:hypothetical protein
MKFEDFWNENFEEDYCYSVCYEVIKRVAEKTWHSAIESTYTTYININEE